MEKNTKNEAMLYCKLTGRTIKDEEIHIQRHIHGKKFLKALDHCRFTVGQHDLVYYLDIRERMPKIGDRISTVATMGVQNESDERVLRRA